MNGTLSTKACPELELNRPSSIGSGLGDRHFHRRGHGIEFEMEADWVRFHLSPKLSLVADIGCGNGSLFPVIGTDRALGVDYCAEGLSHTSARFPSVPLLCADAASLPFSDCQLDAITAQHVVEHIPAYKQACREWWRVLRPGGKLLLLTPNPAFCDPAVYDDKTHVRLFDPRDLSAVLTDAGFAINDLRTIGLPWFRGYRGIPAGWRVRRLVTRRLRWLSTLPPWRWRGQTLCCAARRPMC